MKKRSTGFLSEEKISHDSEIFDYIKELHSYLWQFVRIAFPGVRGKLDIYVDHAVKELKRRKRNERT